jgi:nucleoside-diphosphate-sugar epimerase
VAAVGDSATTARILHTISLVTPSSAIGVLGASSLVGQPLLDRLSRSGHDLLACSRSVASKPNPSSFTWWKLGEPLPNHLHVGSWIALCPPWATVEAFDWLVASGATRLVALSSASTIAKKRSPDAGERRLAARLIEAEHALESKAKRAGIALVILRSTMIYDGTSDHNTASIAAFVRRFGWFPIAAPALGLRQPVHADDVAAACVAALMHPAPKPMYWISGGETLTFRDLVERICRCQGLRSRLISLPRVAWQVASLVASIVGRGGRVTLGTAARMNDDLSCDHCDAARDLGFQPRPFLPGGGTGSRPEASKPVVPEALS